MTQTTKTLLKNRVGAEIKKRASAYAEQRVQDTAVAKVSATVTAKASQVVDKASEIADKADEKLQTFRKIERIGSWILAAAALFASVYHTLNRIYSFIPKLKKANDKVAELTGVDIASKILPSDQ